MKGIWRPLILIETLITSAGLVGAENGHKWIYLLSLPKENNLLSTSRIFVTLRDNEPANVTVESPHDSRPFHENSLLEDVAMSWTVSVPQHFVLANSKKYATSCIRIESSRDIEVVYETRMLWNGGSFRVMPLTQLACHYVVMTTCQANYCFIVVTSAADDNQVNVTLAAYRRNAPASIRYDNTQYQNGEEIREVLEAYQSMQLLGARTDLTGSVVTSSQPIAVVSGGNFDRAESYGYVDAAQEQIPPVESLGNRYVIGGFPTSLGTTYRVFITFVYPNTSVTYDDAAVVTVVEENARKQLIHVGTGNTVVVTADQPVLVVIQNPFGRASTDAASIVSMPTNQWAHEFVVALSNRISTNPYIVLMARNDCSNSFRIQSSQAQNVTTSDAWVTAGEFKATSVQVNVTGDSPIRVSNSQCAFGGFVLVVERIVSVGYPLGWTNVTLSNREVEVPVPIQITTAVWTMAESTDINLTMQTPTNRPRRNDDYCTCPCDGTIYTATATSEEKEELAKSIRKSLQVDTPNLSATIRKKTSAKDKRQSSAYIGSSIAVSMMVVVLGSIIVPDLLKLGYLCYHFLCQYHKID